MNSMESRGVRNPQKMTASLATVFVVLTISFLAAVPVEGQTATYSDAYVIDNSGVTYDPQNDADVIRQEQGPPNQIAGVGVTEADYSSYSESVETTLTVPSASSAAGPGRAAAGSGAADSQRPCYVVALATKLSGIRVRGEGGG